MSLIDPNDLPDHSQRRRPIRALCGRALGVDLSPNWIGLAAASNCGNGLKIEDAKLLEARRRPPGRGHQPQLLYRLPDALR